MIFTNLLNYMEFMKIYLGKLRLLKFNKTIRYPAGYTVLFARLITGRPSTGHPAKILAEYPVANHYAVQLD